MNVLYAGMLVPLLIHSSAGAAEPVPCDPKEMWERLVVAKGGRERLESVHTFLIVGQYRWRQFLTVGKLDYRHLYVMPDFVWHWWDAGDKRFPVLVSFTDSRRQVGMSVGEIGNYGVRRSTVTGHPGDAQLLLFLPETKWLKPRPVSCVADPAGAGETIQLDVEVDSKPSKLRFYFLNSNALPSRVDRFFERYTSVDLLQDYTEVGGIMLPSQHKSRELIGQRESGLRPLQLKVKYEINPEYDPAFLRREPSITAGPDAWRPAKGKTTRKRPPLAAPRRP